MNRETPIETKVARRILAIDPGTLELGIAVLEDGEELDFYAVKSLTRHNSSGQVFRKLVREYQPDLFAIEKVWEGCKRCSKQLLEVARSLAQAAQGFGLRVKSLTWREVAALVARSEQATKAEVAKALCHRFPELAPYRKPPHIFSEAYWLRMFDAVAIAVAASAREVPSGGALSLGRTR